MDGILTILISNYSWLNFVFFRQILYWFIASRSMTDPIINYFFWTFMIILSIVASYPMPYKHHSFFIVELFYNYKCLSVHMSATIIFSCFTTLLHILSALFSITYLKKNNRLTIFITFYGVMGTLSHSKIILELLLQNYKPPSFFWVGRSPLNPPPPEGGRPLTAPPPPRNQTGMKGEEYFFHYKS